MYAQEWIGARSADEVMRPWHAYRPRVDLETLDLVDRRWYRNGVDGAASPLDWFGLRRAEVAL